ncbi:MAG: 2OG-Fe(II) oxygenase [Alphaproteobacteria bacterium]|nr:2OG-Fe(II) oxygenase [Alphaproteobacteria bacterium]
MSLVEVERTGPGEAPSLEVREAGALGEEDLLARVFAGELGGVVVRGGLSGEEAAAVVHRLRTAPGRSGPVQAHPFPGWTYGAVLVVSAPDLGEYLDRAEGLDEALAGLSVGPRIAGLWRALGGGRDVATPTHQGRSYAPLTVRALAPGQGVSVHSERDDWPSMAGLAGLIGGRGQLSTYMPLALCAAEGQGGGEGGGELRVFHRPPPGQEPAMEGRREADAEAALAAFGVTVVRPAVGDLLVFDGGRFNHRVTPCTAGERWTIGAFLAQSADGRRWAWS